MTTNLFDLKGKTALVTGAGSGLGLAFARGLADHGARVILADRNLEWAQEGAASIAAAGGQALALQTDVADADSVERLVERAHGWTGTIDILVNNAGIATRPFRLHELPIADWDRLIAINLRGVFLCTRAVLPVMLSGGGGSIISLASIVGVVGVYPGHTMVNASYAASKAGVSGITRQVAVEYAKDKIRANAIAPGWHGGTRLGHEARAGATEEVVKRFESSIVAGTPMGRRGTPEELVGLVVYLASDASRYLTGQTIVHDGGWTTI